MPEMFQNEGLPATPIMGHLPEERHDPGYPFQTTGVDYAGPLTAAERKGRGCKIIKVYVVVFVHVATKNLYLDLVTKLRNAENIKQYFPITARSLLVLKIN